MTTVSWAGDATYLIEKIPVEISGKSPSAARQKATAIARRDAFLVLLGRLEVGIKVADNVTDEEISDMVRSEQIEEEKIAGNVYSASFNIVFAKDFVDHILAKKKYKKIKKSDEESLEQDDPQILIPVTVERGRFIIWEENNDWKTSIDSYLKRKATKKFIIPEGDIDTISIINSDRIKTIGYPELEPILTKYKSDAAHILFFQYDSIENKVNIDVLNLRKLQKKQVRLSFLNIDHLSQEALLRKVTEKTIEHLLANQRLENKALNSNLIQIGIPISSLRDWLDIKERIESSNLVTQINIESISKDYVLVSVNYPNMKVEIDRTFMTVGIVLDKTSENMYLLRR